MADSLEELAAEVREGVTTVDAALARIQREARLEPESAWLSLAFELGAEEIPGVTDEFTIPPEMR